MGFKIDKINYNKRKDNFFVYASKDGKYFDSAIDENSEVELF